jgi:transposase InsO family protein
VKEWISDNGGEFANDRYKKFLTTEGIRQELGAPYTPQTQGLVERANGTVKRLLGKVLRSLQLPVYTRLACTLAGGDPVHKRHRACSDGGESKQEGRSVSSQYHSILCSM